MLSVDSGRAAHVINDLVRKRDGTDTSRQLLGSTSIYAREDACAEYCVAQPRESQVVRPGDWCRCEVRRQNNIRLRLTAYALLELLRREVQPDPSESLDDDVKPASASRTSDIPGPTSTEGVEEQATSTVSLNIPSTTIGTHGDSPLPIPSTHTSIELSASTLVVPTSTTGWRNGSTGAASAFTSAAATVGHVAGHGTDQSVRIGLGVGLGVGIPVLLALVAFWCLWRRKRKTTSFHSKSERHGQSNVSKAETTQQVPIKPAESPRPPTKFPERYSTHYPGKSGLQDRSVFRKPLPRHNFETPTERSPVALPKSERQTRNLGPGIIIPSGGVPGPDCARVPSPAQEWSPLSRISSISAVSRISSCEPSPSPH